VDYRDRRSCCSSGREIDAQGGRDHRDDTHYVWMRVPTTVQETSRLSIQGQMIHNTRWRTADGVHTEDLSGWIVRGSFKPKPGIAGNSAHWWITYARGAVSEQAGHQGTQCLVCRAERAGVQVLSMRNRS